MSLILHVTDGTKDLSRYKRTLTVAADTIVGGTPYFDGTGDEIQFHATGIVLSRASATISLWIKPTNFPAATYIHFVGNNNMAAGYAFVGSYGSSMRAESDTNGDMWMNAVTGVTDVWKHLVLNADSGTVTSFLNGTLVDTQTPSDDMTVNSISSSLAPFTGFTDDIRLYDDPRGAGWAKDYYHRTRERIRGR